MKQSIVSMLLFMVTALTLNAQNSWTYPEMPLRDGLPPTDEPVFLYNVKKGGYITAGTTWGTHAALTYDITDAFPYILYEKHDLSYTYYQFYSTLAGGQHFLFNAETGNDVYTDYGVSSNPYESTYWKMTESSNGCFRIMLSERNNWYSERPDYCIGWDPYNTDKANNGSYTNTNIGLFTLPPDSPSNYGLDWKYLLVSDLDIYNARVRLYDALVQAQAQEEDTSYASSVYNNPSATLEELLDACTRLGGGVDMTGFIVNPSFDGSVNGWTVDMPGAQNKGYQGASYSGNANININRFAEAWVPTPGTLGAGSISQLIQGLPAGKYVLEADVIACNQATLMEADGVTLFAQGEALFEQDVRSNDRSPRHFSCTFIIEGSEVTIGLRTTAETTANWIAFDNLQLTYYGIAESTATSVSISPRTLSLVIGESGTLTATVNGISDELFNHVRWSSSNENIAIVDNTGKVMGVGSGQATITAKAISSTKQSQISVTVEKNDASKLLINEIQIANIDMFIDPSYNYGGWVEFYNPSDANISLGGLYVSDDPANKQKVKLPVDAGIVPAHGFANIWFDHYDTGTAHSREAYKQVDFKLAYEGGVLYVSDTDGNLLITQTYPAAIQRASYARKTDGGTLWGWTATPSPAATNIGSTFATQQLAAPVVDKDATVFSSPLTVNVTIPSGATLRYTTDGSTPTLTNGYTSTSGVFQVSYASAIYRFRLFRDGYLPSVVVTRSYIYKDRDYYLPIVSVVTDNRNLYDDEIGAYVDGTNGTSGNNKAFSNKNRSWDRPVNFEYLVPDDGGSFLMALNQECDFEVCGGWSRHFDPASSFRLKGGKYYLGQNFFPYSIFEDKPYIKNKGIVVRNGGNDNYGRLRDAAIHEVILKSGFYVDCQSTQPAHVFINGQYRFMFNIREPNNKNHGYSNYGIDNDEMDQFEINGTLGYEQKVGDDVVFRQWMALAQQLADNPTNDALYQQICDIVDIDEYVNYMAAECYVGCGDWLTNSNNVKGYRAQADGKYHLVFMDLDSGFGSTNMISNLRSYLYDSRYDTGKNFLIDIFLNMLNYEPFKKKFIDAFSIVDGSVFESTRTADIVNAMKDNAYKAMGFDGLSSNIANSANSLINDIKNGRPDRLNNIRNYFGLSSPYNIQMSSNVEGAVLKINGQEVPTGKFDGKLFAPVTLSALAPAGYRFKGWQVVGGNASLTDVQTVFDINASWKYYDQGSLDSQSWKDTSYNTSSWKTGAGPFGYGNVGIDGTADYQTTLNYGKDSSNKRPTYYLRKSFTLDSTPTVEDVYQLTYYVDDGFVVYVNGVEIGRYLLSGTPNYSTYTTTYVSATAATATFTIDNSLLRQGENVIAVEVHNCSGTSSDIYWAATLVHGTLSSSSYASTEENLDLTAFDTQSVTLLATYEQLPDEQLLADIATPLKVNEVSASNSIFVNDVFKKNDWLELYNMTDTDINVAGLYVSDDIDDPLKYQIPTTSVANTIIPAHGHLVVWADKLEATTQLHAPFKLGNTDGEMVLITSSDDFAAANPAFVAAHPALRDFADALTYNMHRGDQSVGRYPDGANAFYLMNLPTIDKQNSLRSFDAQIGVDTGIMSLESDFTLDLAQGWNWVSHPFSAPLSVNQFKDHADRILSQTLEAYYSSQTNSMAGGLKTLSSGEMYKFEVDAPCTYHLQGQIPHASDSRHLTLDLMQGWNWIGYPAIGTRTLNAALSGSQIDDGDMIVGQNGFSVYSTDDGWVGTLSSLTPATGYLYRSATTKSIRFNITSPSSVRLRRPKYTKSLNQSLFDKHAYPNVMGLIADLRIDDHSSTPDFRSSTLDPRPSTLDPTPFTILAYDAEGRCRGVGEVVDTQIFMTLYGQGDEPLTFKAVDEDGTVYSILEKINFVPDVIGTRSSPVHLTIGSTIDTLPTTLVSQPSALDSRPIGYYTLSGIFRGNTPNALSPGIYLVRLADGQCRKVLIR